MNSHDVIVSGGGPAGLVSALAFARLGKRVLCIDPAPPVRGRETKGADLRSTALMQPSRAFLEDLGIWPRIAEDASPLRIMRIVDAGGKTAEPRLSRNFDSHDIGHLPFGWNVPNWTLRATLAEAAEAAPEIDLRFGRAVSGVLPRTTEIRVALDDGTSAIGQLLIAADGRDSFVRQAVGIGARTMRYGQKALAFIVTHPIPHDEVSTEVHRSGGPFTMVPLPDLDGRPCSAVIWMERGAEARRLADLPDTEFETEATARSSALFGPLRLESRCTVWPIISRIADRLIAERTALVAEAAHVVPPIGAQGLNMSLGDIEALSGIAAKTSDRLGSREMLGQYQRDRWPEIAARVSGVDALNRASMADAAILRDARMQGLRALHAVPPVRKALMRTGLGAVL